MDALTPLVREPVSVPTAGPATKPDRTDARVRESAREFESVFLSFLLKTMRRTVPEGATPALGGGNRVYQEMMDDELARTVSKGRGIGLAEILMRDLAPKKALKSPVGKVDGQPAVALRTGAKQ